MSVLVASAAVLALVPLAGCGDRDAKAAVDARADVTAMHPISRELTPVIELPGTVAPSATVTLVARVQGALKEIGFKDGSYVSKGQMLFRIEPDTYRAQLAYDQAELDNAALELKRQQALTDDDATSDSTLQKARTTRDQALARRDMSRINFGYTEIRAPFAGRIGARAFDVGNIVGMSDSSKLATLDRIQPVYVNFTLNERDANRVGILTNAPRYVTVSIAGSAAAREDKARLEFVDTRVDSSSGALSLRASVTNDDAHLIPGMSVSVRIPAAAPRMTWLVPDSAVQRDQAGSFVLVVDGAGVLSRRDVATAGLYGGMRAIDAGLAGSDQVVTGGALDVAPGAKVRVLAAQGQARS